MLKDIVDSGIPDSCGQHKWNDFLTSQAMKIFELSAPHCIKILTGQNIPKIAPLFSLFIILFLKFTRTIPRFALLCNFCLFYFLQSVASWGKGHFPGSLTGLEWIYLWDKGKNTLWPTRSTLELHHEQIFITTRTYFSCISTLVN